MMWAVVLLASLAVAATAEMVARYIEPKSEGAIVNLPEPTLGWVPRPGQYRVSTPEFTMTASINALGMNDRELTDADRERMNRILVLGDSHTFAVGASTFETWPKRLEALLFSQDKSGVVWNAAVIGYSVGQYLERFRGVSQSVRPTLVLVGFSMATDVYDLIPPERGGFVYGGDAARVYFDLGADGKLLEKVYSAPKADRQTDTPSQIDTSLQIRGFLERFALYRMLKRSNLAMWIAIHYRPGDSSLWPGLDTALKKDLTEDDKYRWLLAEKVLAELVQEAGQVGAKVVIVNIPYLAQVYDETWSASFGAMPDKYDRWIATQRLSDICGRIGATCIDTTKAFVDAVHQRGRWLHFPQDAHPTPEGQELIAKVVAAGLIQDGLILGAPAPLQ
jgi:lysophospholipase L1-like esterase